MGLIIAAMTQLLDQAVETARALSPERQDDIARVVLAFAAEDEQSVLRMTAEELSSLEISRAQAARREFAADEEVRAVWAKHGL
jgi:hypothetical protein